LKRVGATGKTPDSVTDEALEALRRYDVPTLANGIETFDVRSRAAGYAGGDIRCVFPELPIVNGHAVTARIRAAEPSDEPYARRSWWEFTQTVPAPRMVVIQDLDDPPGVGSFWGEVNGSIHRALGCVGVVTNGSVRDLSEVRAIPFHYFAGSIAVSHAYVHLVDFGTPVEVGGLTVETGDLLQGDQHGVISIPADLVADLPAACDRVIAKERVVIDYCRTPDFTIDGLANLSWG
jgi:regulator of RNase E activity RraA